MFRWHTVVLLVGLARAAYAQDATPPLTPETTPVAPQPPTRASTQDATVPVPADPGLPADVDPKGLEWVRLSSGEWLNGQFKYLRDDKLQFESEDLNELTINWDDVKFAWLTRDHIWTFEEGGSLHGSGIVFEDRIVVRTPEGVVAFGRDRLASVVRGGSRRLDLWELYVSVGFDGRWGNTQQLNLTWGAGLSREDGRTRFELEYTGGWGEASEELTIFNHYVKTQLDVFLSKKLFITPAHVDAYIDEFQNLRPRVNVGAGLGTRLTPDEDFVLKAGAGVAWQHVQYVSVETGEPPVFNGIGVLAGGGFEWDITGDVDLDLDWQSMVILNDIGKTSHHGQLRFAHEIIDDVEYDLGVVYDRTEQPQATIDGTEPKSNDLQLTFGFRLTL